jgi:uncharacterized glyoxalase superfamily protein PhnB
VARSFVPSIAAAMRYRDVGAASDWLCAAFGFHKHLVATSETGVVHYAQLTFGNAMLMLAPVRDDALDKYMKQPDEIGGAETQSCYLLVSDADAHYARAKASGAEIILDIQDDDFGGRSYACRDPESHIWNFGTYDPWQGKRTGGQRALSDRRYSPGLRRLAMAIALLTTIGVSAGAGWMYGALTPDQRNLAAVAKEAEERAIRAAQERLNIESSAKMARDARGLLDRERIARETAESIARDARQELDRLRNAKPSDSSEPEQLDRERAARETAERAANQARDQLSRERSAKNAALRAAAQLRRQLGQLQNAKQVAEETYVDPESPTAEAKSAAARPKQKQKAKAPPQQD